MSLFFYYYYFFHVGCPQGDTVELWYRLISRKVFDSRPGTFFGRIYMFSLYLRRFSLGSFHSPKSCMWGETSFFTGMYVNADICLCGPAINWQRVPGAPLPFPYDSRETPAEPRDSMLRKKGIENGWMDAHNPVMYSDSRTSTRRTSLTCDLTADQSQDPKEYTPITNA